MPSANVHVPEPNVDCACVPQLLQAAPLALVRLLALAWTLQCRSHLGVPPCRPKDHRSAGATSVHVPSEHVHVPEPNVDCACVPQLLQAAPLALVRPLALAWTLQCHSHLGVPPWSHTDHRSAGATSVHVPSANVHVPEPNVDCVCVPQLLQAAPLALVRLLALAWTIQCHSHLGVPPWRPTDHRSAGATSIHVPSANVHVPEPNINCASVPQPFQAAPLALVLRLVLV